MSKQKPLEQQAFNVQLPLQQQREEQQQRDPMELSESHFEQDSTASHDAFLEEFAAPVVPSMNGVNEQDDAAASADASGTDEAPLEFDNLLEESEKAELAELNSVLKSDFKSLKELRDAIKKQDAPKEDSTIEQDRAHINYFKDILNPKQYNDRRIVMEDKRMALQQEGKDVNDPLLIEELTLEVDRLEENGVLNYAANTLRDTVRRALEKKEAVVGAYDAQKEDSKIQTETQRKESLQVAISTYFKEGFMGVKPTKEDMIEIYKEANKNSQNLSSNPQEVVEFALFKRYKSQIGNSLGKGSFKDGVKTTLEGIGLTGSQQTVNSGSKAQGNNEEEKSYFDKFIQ